MVVEKRKNQFKALLECNERGLTILKYLVEEPSEDVFEAGETNYSIAGHKLLNSGKLRELEELDLIRKGDGDYFVTPEGKHCYDEFVNNPVDEDEDEVVKYMLVGGPEYNV